MHVSTVTAKSLPKRLLLAVDLAGTALFAVEGARSAIAAGLDLLGVPVLAFVTALAGGILRDVLISAIPPQALRDWRFPAVALAAGASAFIGSATIGGLPSQAILIVDAAGLGLFAVAGAQKTLAAGMHPLVAILMGGVSAVGGDAVRDLLLARVRTILHADVYATAALLGAAVTVGVRLAGRSASLAGAAGSFVCFTLRMLSLWRHGNLPTAQFR